MIKFSVLPITEQYLVAISTIPLQVTKRKLVLNVTDPDEIVSNIKAFMINNASVACKIKP